MDAPRSAPALESRLAALDFGSNTIGYLIGRAERGRFVEIERASEFIRLAEGSRNAGRLSEAAIARALVWTATPGVTDPGAPPGRSA